MKAEVKGLPKRYFEYGFKDMIANKDNSEFIKIAKEQISLPPKSIVFCGGVGNGKTRLAVSIMRNHKPVESETIVSREYDQRGTEIKKAKIIRPCRSIFIISDEYFQHCNEAVSTYQSKMNYINDLLSYDICCIDDLGIENFSGAKQENLYLLINRAYTDERCIYLTTNFGLEELEKIDPRITDRLREMALILKFEGKSFRD